MPVDACLKCGEIALSRGHFAQGCAAYGAAQVNPPQQKLVECGELNLRAGNFVVGRASYELAKVQMPRDLVTVCGHEAHRAGRLEDAWQAFAWAHDSIGLQRVVDSAARNGTLEHRVAIGAAFDLGGVQALRALGDLWVALDMGNLARLAFRASLDRAEDQN